MLHVIFAQRAHDLSTSSLLANHIVVPLGTLLRERFSKLITVWALAFEDPALIDHKDHATLRDEEDSIASSTVTRIPAELTLGLHCCCTAKDAVALAPLAQLLHSRSVSAALTTCHCAHDVAGEQTDGTFLKLFAAPTALTRVVFLDKVLEITRQLNEVEGEVGRQQVKVIRHADHIIVLGALHTLIFTYRHID